MSRVRVNYKSDLPPIEVTFKVNSVEADVPTHDFVLRFFVEGCSESYYCGCKYEDGDAEYFHCSPSLDGSKLTCFINNHKFVPGRLCVEYIDLAPNDNYEDGVKKTVIPEALDVVLIDGAGDEVDNVVSDTFHYKVGKGILSVTKTSASGVVDTYTITFDDGSITTYTVTNGRDGVNLGDVAVADDLVTNDPTKVLSAKQGYVLGNDVAPMKTTDSYTSSDLLDGYWNIGAALVHGTAVSTTRQASPSPTASPYHLYKSLCIPVKRGDVVTVNTNGLYTARPWTVTDTDRFILSTTDETYGGVTSATLTIEEDGFVYVNCVADDETVTTNNINGLASFSVTKTTNYAGNVKKVPKLASQTQSQYGVKEYDADCLSLEYAWANALSVETVDIYNVYNSYHGCLFFPVYCGDTVEINTKAYTAGSTSQAGGITNGVTWCVTDTARNIVSAADATDDAVEVTLHIEQDGFVFINCANDYEDENEEKLFAVTHTYNKVRKETELSAELDKRINNPTENTMVLYYGHSGRVHWRPSELEHVLIHTHTTGEKKGVTEWFFNSLLYVEFTTGWGNDGRSFGWAVADNSRPATKADFEWLIDRYFSENLVGGEHEGLRALEEKIGDLKKTMGVPPRRHKVILTIPIPYYYLHGSDDTSSYNHWGKLHKTDIPSYNDGWEEGDPWADIFGEYDTLLFDVEPEANDGECAEMTLNTLKVDGEVINNRPIIMKWFIDCVIERFNAKNYQNIELAGLYWVAESLTYPQYVVQPRGIDPIIGDISEYIRGKGFKMYWVPFRNANGRFSRAGIDETFLQTAYEFDKGLSLTKEVMRNAYKEAVMHGMGVEIELDDKIFSTFGDPSAINNAKMTRLEELMEVCEEEMFFNRVDTLYYFSGKMQIWMSQSPVERVRKFMDRLCTLINNVESSATSLSPVIATKQDTLISGANIKTINNQSLLGSGNITIQGGGGGSSVQSDWSESDSSSDAYIKNKPSLADVATSGSYDDLNDKPTIPAAQIQADWNQVTTTAKDYIKNKPTIPAAQVQSNWNESNTSSKAYIQNKPTIPTVPTNVSAFTNDAGYLTQHQSIKTVNNTSLVGSGNMNLAKPVGVIAVAGATPTQTLSPNTFYKFTGAITSLTLTLGSEVLGSEVSGIMNIYAFRFTAGVDNPTITLPQGVVINQDLSLKTGDVCEFSIMDNKALFSVWQAQS